jgi:membrane protein
MPETTTAADAQATRRERMRRAWAWVRSILPDTIRFAKEASRRMDEVSVRLYAAAIAYRTIFSLIAFLSTAGLVALYRGIDADEIRLQAGGIADFAGVSNDLEEVGRERAARTIELGQSTVWIAGVLGFLVGLYTLSGGFATLCEVLDRVHGVHRYRPLSRRYLRGAGVSILFLLLTAIVVSLLSFTNQIGNELFAKRGLEVLDTLWTLLFRIIIPACAVVITFGFVLRFGSHARPPWKEVLPGAAVASASWVLMVIGFISYVAIFDGFEGYGALSTAVAVLFFGYMQAWIIILVALFRTEIAFVIALLPFVRQSSDGASLEFGIRPDARP